MEADALQIVQNGPMFQRRGLLLGIERVSGEIAIASENASEVLAFGSIADVIGKTLVDTVGPDISHALRNVESRPNLTHRPQSIGLHRFPEFQCHLTAFLSGEYLVVEGVAMADGQEPTAIDVLSDVQILTEVLRTSSSEIEMLERLVPFLRTLSGYHLVKVERQIGSAVETMALSGKEEFEPVDCLATSNLHAIYDATAAPQRLVTPFGVSVPDLELSSLQLPDTASMAALRSSKVFASAGLRLQSKAEVWGKLTFLHGAPRMPSLRTQLVLMHLLPLLESRLEPLS